MTPSIPVTLQAKFSALEGGMESPSCTLPWGYTRSLFPPDLASLGCVFRTQAAETSTPLGDAVTQRTEQGRRGWSSWGGATAARSQSRPMIGPYNGPAFIKPRPSVGPVYSALARCPPSTPGP